MSDVPLPTIPAGLSPKDLESVHRFLRVFGPRRLPRFLQHLQLLDPNKPWFVCVDRSGARYFTHFRKLERVVKNPRSITGSQKFIASVKDNYGILF